MFAWWGTGRRKKQLLKQTLLFWHGVACFLSLHKRSRTLNGFMNTLRLYILKCSVFRTFTNTQESWWRGVFNWCMKNLFICSCEFFFPLSSSLVDRWQEVVKDSRRWLTVVNEADGLKPAWLVWEEARTVQRDTRAAPSETLWHGDVRRRRQTAPEDGRHVRCVGPAWPLGSKASALGPGRRSAGRRSTWPTSDLPGAQEFNFLFLSSSCPRPGLLFTAVFPLCYTIAQVYFVTLSCDECKNTLLVFAGLVR